MEAVDLNLLVVVRTTPLTAPHDRGTERVAHLRAAALAALAEAARLCGAKLGALQKDERDAPVESGGWHWSISHTSLESLGLVAASVSRTPVGVDAEALGTRKPELVQHVLAKSERALFRDNDSSAFTRAWTAKEAVLKKLGLGLMALSEVQVEDVHGDQGVLVRDGTRHAVEWRDCGPFVVAIAGRARECVDWRVGDDVDARGARRARGEALP